METGSRCKVFKIVASYCGMVFETWFALAEDKEAALLNFKKNHVPDVDYSINKMYPVDLSVIKFSVREVCTNLFESTAPI